MSDTQQSTEETSTDIVVEETPTEEETPEQFAAYLAWMFQPEK